MKKLVLLCLFAFSLSLVFSQTQNALDFDGINDRVEISNGGALKGLNTGTIELWVKWSGIQDAGYGGSGLWGVVIGRQGNGVFSNQLIGLSGTDPATAKIRWNPYAYGGIAITGSISPGNNTWVHIAITYSSGSHNLYINGITDGTGTASGSVNIATTHPMTIGAWIDAGASYSTSQIDEVRIWNVVRTETEIRNNMYGEISNPTSETNLVAYYQFNETSGATLPDKSANSNDGTLTNMDPSTDWISSTAPIPYYSVANGNWNSNSTWASGQNSPSNSWANINIDNDVTITSAEDCEDMTISSGNSITVNENHSLTVNGTLTNSAGNSGMVVKSSSSGTGSLIESSGTSATVERYYTGNQWHMISSPVSNAVSGMYSGLYLMSHSEPTNTYSDIVSTTVPLNGMQGYSLWNQNGNATASYTGLVNTGILSKGLTRSSAGNVRGWNLVGNPYPSSIDWDASTGWTKSNVGGTIYLYTGITWATYNTNTGGTNGGIRYIASGQGFFVSVNDDGSTSGTLGMTNDVRVHDATAFFKNGSSDILKLEVSNEEYSDETIIMFAEESTPGFDSQFDAYKLFSMEVSVPQIYSTANGFMAANVLPEVNAVPIDVRANDGDLLTIGMIGENDFTEVYLEDLETGIMSDLKKDSYSFIYDENLSGRFIVHLTPLSVIETPESQISILSFNNEVHVFVPEGTVGNIYIFNVMGQQISSAKINHNENIISLEKGAIYLVKVVSGESVVAKKVYVK